MYIIWLTSNDVNSMYRKSFKMSPYFMDQHVSKSNFLNIIFFAYLISKFCFVKREMDFIVIKISQIVIYNENKTFQIIEWSFFDLEVYFVVYQNLFNNVYYYISYSRCHIFRCIKVVNPISGLFQFQSC